MTRTFRGGKRDAEQELARLVTEVSGGGHASHDTTLADLIREWFAMASRDLSPTTARGYQWIVNAYVLPSLRDVPLSKLRAVQLDRFYARLRDSGGRDGKPLSAATVRQVHAIIRRALQQGVRWDWIATNPADAASPPRQAAAQITPPDPADVIYLLEVAADGDADFGCFLHAAATTGARRGELCGLQWRDLDLAAGTVTISRNVVEGAHSVIVEKDTKTHASRRIALDPSTVAALEAQRERMQIRAAASDATLGVDAHVFSRDADGKQPWRPNDVTKRFMRVRHRAGLDSVRLHDLRHFAATRLLSAGVPVRTVSGRLGHANAATTLGVYAHFVEASDRDAAAALGALLSRPLPAAPASETQATA